LTRRYANDFTPAGARDAPWRRAPAAHRPPSTSRKSLRPRPRDPGAATTLAVAAAFRPLRTRIQRTVDRKFYRSRYDAQQTIERFSAQLRDDIDVDLLAGELLGTIGRALQPARVSLWTATGQSSVRTSAEGETSDRRP
jgi:hypothetical protein